MTQLMTALSLLPLDAKIARIGYCNGDDQPAPDQHRTGDAPSPMGGRTGPCWNCCCFPGNLHISDSMVMLAVVQWRILEILPFCLTAICTHLVVSGGQTFFHCWLGHRRLGGALYRNHIKFHHAYYARGHLVSATYRSGEGNNTPFFLIPTVLAAAGMFFLLPLELFVVTALVGAASFYAHVLLDKEYHVENSRLERFAWFRRKQQLHFVHHLHADRNFAVIDFFWDKLMGTYQSFETDVADLDNVTRSSRRVENTCASASS